MFTLFGAILVVYGIVDRAASTRLGININLTWGAFLLVFGVLMLTFALRARSRNGSGGKPQS